MLDDEQQRREEGSLAAAISDFRRRWRPGNEEDQEFETELYQLIYTAHRLAQQPLIRHMSAALALVPATPIFVRQK